MRLLLVPLLLVVALLLVGLLLRLLFPLPALEPRVESWTLEDNGETVLGQAAARRMAENPGLNGIYPLVEAREAFAARVLMIRNAERSLDLQYYIWHPDVSGMLMLEAVLAAAERGVRVRILVDDNGIGGMDQHLAALDSHPNIEIRLFNPFTIRTPKAIGYLMDFPRLNRRMHNKALIADNQVTIVGGRNIGDEYFGASRESLFADLDVLAIGPIVPDMSRDFDRYWRSESSYPAARILPSVTPGHLELIHLAARARGRTPLAEHYLEAVRRSLIDHDLLTGNLQMVWADVRMVSDDPAKALGKARRTGLLTTRLASIIGMPERELGLVSAYFVPTKDGAAGFAALARQGVDVSILTNSLQANDVALVHVGYAPYRTRLLKAGVRLFELKAEHGERARLNFVTGFGSGGSGAGRLHPPGTILRSRGSALHAKTFSVDRRRMFVGSFNFDPRSVHLNTELGFVIESSQLAGQLQDMFDEQMQDVAYEVRLAADRRSLEWVEQLDGRIIVHGTEPGTRAYQRLIMKMLSLLPIEWLL